MNVIVVGREPTYWAQVTDGVVVHIAVVDKEPAQYGLANTDVMKSRRERHPESVFVHLEGIEPRPGLGWLYDGKTFSPPEPDESAEALWTEPVTADSLGIDQEQFNEIVRAVAAQLRGAKNV